jgi:hypothetical protein
MPNYRFPSKEIREQWVSELSTPSAGNEKKLYSALSDVKRK